jgi:hypothetical protein
MQAYDSLAAGDTTTPPAPRLSRWIFLALTIRFVLPGRNKHCVVRQAGAGSNNARVQFAGWAVKAWTVALIQPLETPFPLPGVAGQLRSLVIPEVEVPGSPSQTSSHPMYRFRLFLASVFFPRVSNGRMTLTTGP